MHSKVQDEITSQTSVAVPLKTGSAQTLSHMIYNGCNYFIHAVTKINA